MSRLVLRIAVGILVVLVASSVIVQLGSASLRRSFERGISEHLGQVLEARARVDRARPEELQAEIGRLRRELGQPVLLVARTDPSIPAATRDGLGKGPQLAFTGHRRGWTVYLPVQNGSVLVLGPIRPNLGRSYPIEAVAAGILATVGLAAFLVASPLVRRLRGLERAATRIGEGELQARADATKNDAIGRVAKRFNHMAERVQELLERQKGLLQAVSHELRTPVARMRFGLEMLLAAKNDEERGRRAAALDEDLTELDQLVEELLLYMRAGESALELRQKSFPVAGALDAILLRLQELRPEVEVIREEEVERGALVLADERLFRRALQNLIGNGLRHARSKLRIRIVRRGDRIEAAIEDDGDGVPSEHRERIFEPFARLDDSRSRGSGGVGLGLAIARRIVVTHGGEISVADAEGGGARFATTWPAGPDTNGDRGATQTRRIGGGEPSH